MSPVAFSSDNVDENATMAFADCIPSDKQDITHSELQAAITFYSLRTAFINYGEPLTSGYECLAVRNACCRTLTNNSETRIKK